MRMPTDPSTWPSRVDVRSGSPVSSITNGQVPQYVNYEPPANKNAPARRQFGTAWYNWNPGMQVWTVDYGTPAAAAAPGGDMGSIFDAAKGFAEKTVPTGDVWANALMDSINTMGQGTLEQFNSRGQGVNSGIFTDALAKNATSMTTQSQLDQSKLLSDTMKDYFTGDKAQYYDQWKTQYQGDLAKEMNQRNIDAYAKALADLKKSKKNNAIGSIIGSGVGAIAGNAIAPGAGAGVGAQYGSQLGGSLADL